MATFRAAEPIEIIESPAKSMLIPARPPIARRCIESHGDRIWAVTNRAGAPTFKLMLKVAAAETG